MSTLYTRASVLEAVRIWLENLLPVEDYDWFNPDTTVLNEPLNNAAPSGPYFTLQLLSFGKRYGSGYIGDMGEPHDFASASVLIQSFGPDAFDALATALFRASDVDSDATNEAVAAYGFVVVPETTEVSQVDQFLETGVDIRGTAVVTVGCLRETQHVTEDASTVVVTGTVDSTLEISVTADVEG